MTSRKCCTPQRHTRVVEERFAEASSIAHRIHLFAGRAGNSSTVRAK